MASKLASDDFDEQFLTCPVCMLHFRDARILPCLHTFCKQCLQEWASKQDPLECPTCRTQVSLPDQGVDGLKTNFYVNNLLDFAAVKKRAEPGVPCQVCEGNVEGPKSWCADCATLMCESCAAVHRKLPATKDHEVTAEEILKAERGVSKFQRKRHCDKHKNHELVFYCESCNALVCTACTVVDHRPGKDHNPVEITSVAQMRKQTLEGLLKQIDPRIREIEASIKEVDRKMSKISPSKDAATNQTKAYFRQLVDMLQKREQEILSQIDEQCRVDSKGLQTKKEATEFELAELTSAQTFCQQAVEHGSDVHVVEVGKQVQSRVETLLAKQMDLKSNWSEFHFVENTSLFEFEKEVKHFGGLETNVDISKCKIAVMPAVRGFRCVTELTTMTKEGCPCVTNSKAVTADMKDPSGNDVMTQLQMKIGGVWEISYTPKVTGKHRLEVKVNSQQVIGRPFEVQVQSEDTPVLSFGREGIGVGDLDGPAGVAVDLDGNIAVVDQGNYRVQIFDPENGQPLKSFPVDGENPYGIDVDSHGRFLVTSFGEDCGIRRYSKEGELLKTIKPDCVEGPAEVTVLKDGRMVVTDGEQAFCLLLQPDGSLIREIGKGHLLDPRFIAVDESRDVMFVTDDSIHKIFTFDLAGNLMFSFGKEGENDGELQNPEGITLDPTDADRETAMKGIVDHLREVYPNGLLPDEDLQWLYVDTTEHVGPMCLLHLSLTEYLAFVGTDLDFEISPPKYERSAEGREGRKTKPGRTSHTEEECVCEKEESEIREDKRDKKGNKMQKDKKKYKEKDSQKKEKKKPKTKSADQSCCTEKEKVQEEMETRKDFIKPWKRDSVCQYLKHYIPKPNSSLELNWHGWANTSETVIEGGGVQTRVKHDGEFTVNLKPGDTAWVLTSDDRLVNWKMDTWMIEYGRGFTPMPIASSILNAALYTRDWPTLKFLLNLYYKGLVREFTFHSSIVQDFLEEMHHLQPFLQ
uniref:RING-type E3 ubiquitin transferase n=1 Tax=Branchiostoma floridae TaxID=7739 RepID=C3YYV3_BRAFL|eukprot:XP_002598449.1 hypothetical protein BRAFLDRAFT_83265 [Branchiostoma floridae]